MVLQPGAEKPRPPTSGTRLMDVRHRGCLARLALARLSQKGVCPGWGQTIAVMARNFIAVDRDQVLSMLLSLADWLPADHFAWFLLVMVEQLDLSAFYEAYGPGRALGGLVFDPRLMVGLSLYAYSKGQQSSRGIELGCVEDVAISGGRGESEAGSRDDRAVSPAGMRRHWRVCSEGGLGLCAESGLVSVRNDRDRRVEAFRERVAGALL